MNWEGTRRYVSAADVLEDAARLTQLPGGRRATPAVTSLMLEACWHSYVADFEECAKLTATPMCSLVWTRSPGEHGSTAVLASHAGKALVPRWTADRRAKLDPARCVRAGTRPPGFAEHVKPWKALQQFKYCVQTF